MAGALCRLVMQAGDSLFFVDKKGDQSKATSDQIPLVPVERPTVVIEPPYKLPPRHKVVVLKDPVLGEDYESDDEDDEDDDGEEVIFKGHLSPSVSSDEVDSDEYVISEDDESDADSDYIRNLEENGDQYLLEDLEHLDLNKYYNVDSEDSDDEEEEDSEEGLGNDEDFAQRAKQGSFLLRSPSTLMEFSLDETAAEYLAEKNRRAKAKGKKGKLKERKEKVQAEIDPFQYEGPYTVGAINFRQINRELKTFINDDVEDELEMDPMPPLPRKFLHELAHMYGLKSKSTGKGRDRHCILYKTERSSLPRNVKQVQDLISRADKAVTWMDKSVTKGKKFTQASVPQSVKETRVRGGKAKGKKKKGPDDFDGPSTKPAVGEVVGHKAIPISEDNVGNKLLQKLGWKPGQGLGSTSEGIVEPISAVYRGRRTGLGHGDDCTD